MSGATRLSVTPSLTNAVVFDIYDSTGRLLDANSSTADLRHFDAGTYYLRAYRPDAPNATGTSRTFTLSVTPPAQGQTRVAFTDPDQDLIRGGDGNDVILAMRTLIACMELRVMICLSQI